MFTFVPCIFSETLQTTRTKFNTGASVEVNESASVNPMLWFGVQGKYRGAMNGDSLGL